MAASGPRAGGLLLVLLTAALLVLSAMARRGWRLAAGLLVSTVALLYTGFLLPWDQLALWAVTVGEGVEGMWYAAFNDDVRFVLIGGVEISQGTLGLWFIVHAGILAAAFAAMLAVLVGSRNPSGDAATALPGPASRAPAQGPGMPPHP